jgi:hypothetical protein
MEDLLIEVLSQFGYPIMLQGSLLKDDPYPDHFFTFWNNSSDSESFYDNDENSIVYDYDVNFYSVNQEWAYSKLREAKAALKKAGFIISGDGYSVMSDESTHDGRGMNVKYLKY